MKLQTMTITANIKQLIALAAITVLCVPYLVSAEAILRSGETVSVTNDQVVEGDFYASGGIVSLSGRVEGDMYTVAGSFTNNGAINGDLSVAAGTVQMHASVADDVRVVGGEVVVAGTVGGDLVVFGGVLKVLSTAKVDGDILFFGGDLQVLGPVEGDIMGMAENVRVDTYVGGAIDVTATRLALGDRAEVVGDVRYVSNNELVRSQNAVVVGEVVQNTAPVEGEVSEENVVIFCIILLFSALILQLLLRQQLQRHANELTGNLGMAGLIGLAVLILAPVLIVIAIVSMLGTLIGLILLALFFLLLFGAAVFTSVLLGGLISKYHKGQTMFNVLYTVGGACIVQLLLLIPVIGHTLAMVVFFLALGVLTRRLFLALRA